ncbi:MAG: hypothetical protein ACFE0P_00130 [Oceanicaulis sp.]
MKHWLTAAAFAPLLIACASSHASETSFARAEEDGLRVLVVNGERIEIGRGRNAAEAIEAALDRGDHRRVRVELQLDETELMDKAEREAFAEAMAALASGFAHDAYVVAFRRGEDFEFDFDFDFDTDMDADVDEAELRRHMERAERAERAERDVQRHAERLECHAERRARHAERLAERAEHEALRAERHGRRMELYGLEAGVEGMEGGLAGIEEALARGWIYKRGERTELTEDDRREMEQARDELVRGLEDMRARLAEARERHGADGEHRQVRIQRRDGAVRAWVDGEEVTGSELDRLLEEQESRLAGAPTPPEPPQR